MRTETHLTIQDYFDRRSDAGVRSRGCNNSKTVPGIGSSTFSQVLAATHPFPQEDRQGLSIQDYLQRRIRTHHIAPSAKVASDLSLHMLATSSGISKLLIFRTPLDEMPRA